MKYKVGRAGQAAYFYGQSEQRGNNYFKKFISESLFRSAPSAKAWKKKKFGERNFFFGGADKFWKKEKFWGAKSGNKKMK